MGVFSEMDLDLREKEANGEQNISPLFTPSSNGGAAAVSDAAKWTLEDDDRQPAESDTTQAVPPIINGEEPPSEDDAGAASQTTPDESETSEDQKKIEHEAKEAQRKAEWDAKQAAKKAAEEKAMQEMLALSDDAVMDASVKRVGIDTERLTRRNMKDCVTEHIQTKCLDDPAFARKAMHPRKNMINCFKYITRLALEYIKQELADNGEPALGFGMGSDVPDGLCYQWAENYFLDPDAEEDKDKEETFVPKPYYGGSSSKTKKSTAKKPAKKAAEKPKEKKKPDDSGQMSLVEQMLFDVAPEEKAG